MMGSGLPEEKFYPGAREAVAALQAAGFKTALVTNKMRMVTETFVQRSGLNADLDVLVAGDDTDHPKPAPDMLLLACEKLGVSPTEAVMVGDSENDAWAAKAAGIRAMLVSTGYNGTVPMTQWAKDNGFPWCLTALQASRITSLLAKEVCELTEKSAPSSALFGLMSQQAAAVSKVQ